MLTIKKWFSSFIFPIAGIMFFITGIANANDNITLYTPYTKISLSPGESVDYAIDVINNSKEIQNADITVTGIPKDWNYTLKSGLFSVQQLSVLPGEKKPLTLKVDIPYKVEKGNYRFNVLAGGSNSLSLVINVSKQGSYQTEFTTDQSNMEGPSTSTFTYSTVLRNRTVDRQLYALTANVAPGWVITFKPNYKQATSVEIEPNSTSNISIDINPPDNIAAGKYEIPVRASTSSTTSELKLQVVITGSYFMELTTPTGLLSASVIRGHEEQIELLVKNTGSSDLSDIKFSFTAPPNWNVTFEPKSVPQLVPGGTTHVYASIKSDKKAIAGDYITTLEAKTPEVSAKATIRILVKTSMIWGWIGILIIIAAAGCVYYLFRKYGRR